MSRMRRRWMKGRAMAWLLLGRPARAMAIFDAMLERWPDDTYALASRAHQNAQCGRTQVALCDSARLVALQPGHAATWFNHGYLLEACGRWEGALEAFARATAADPGLDRAWYGLGLVLIRLQRHDEAVAALKRNTELQPMSPFGWYQLARVHVERREPEEAARIIRHLHGFEPRVAAQLERETGLPGRLGAG